MFLYQLLGVRFDGQGRVVDKALLIHGCFFGWFDFHFCWHIGGSLSSPAALELSGQTSCYSDQYLSTFWCIICFAACLFLVRFGWFACFYKCLFPSSIRGSSCMERSWCCWDMEIVWEVLPSLFGTHWDAGDCNCVSDTHEYWWLVLRGSRALPFCLCICSEWELILAPLFKFWICWVKFWIFRLDFSWFLLIGQFEIRKGRLNFNTAEAKSRESAFVFKSGWLCPSKMPSSRTRLIDW